MNEYIIVETREWSVYATNELDALTAVEAYPSPKPNTSVELMRRETQTVDRYLAGESEDILRPEEHHYREVPWDE